VGQKTHPIGFRLGVIKTWQSNWYSDKNVADLLEEDLMIRRYVKSRMTRAGISRVEIERSGPKKVTITIHTARPGIVIGRKGAEVDKLKDELQHLTSKDVYINIQEIRRPELDAQLIGDSIARQLEQRVSFRRAMKKSLTSAMRMGAEGIKIMCSGRLGGSEMARREQFNLGRVPLHTLRADIDYARSTAHTTYGCVGVKVWICKGEVIVGEDTEKSQTGGGRDNSRS
jgi:small subunit ribosomal protein S3